LICFRVKINQLRSTGWVAVPVCRLVQKLASGVGEGLVGGLNHALRARRVMQAATPDVIDVADEPESIQFLYGTEEEATDNFGRPCFLVRRFA
jgi:Protein of unknown function (DUF1501)